MDHLKNYYTAQSSYLSFLEFTNSTATSGTLPPCDNCTVAVTVPGNGFPFGSYYHSTVYVGYYMLICIYNIMCDTTMACFIRISGSSTIFTKLMVAYVSSFVSSTHLVLQYFSSRLAPMGYSPLVKSFISISPNPFI